MVKNVKNALKVALVTAKARKRARGYARAKTDANCPTGAKCTNKCVKHMYNMRVHICEMYSRY